MNATHKRRLLKLADFLDTVPPKRFDFRYWVGSTWKGKEDLSCGTTACALGWATTMPIFRRLGLRLMRSATQDGSVVLQRNGEDLIASPELAARYVFGLDRSSFRRLFIPTSIFTVLSSDQLPGDATAKQVARHIRTFVARS